MPARASESLGHCQRWAWADPLDEFSYEPSMSKFLTRFRENQSFSTVSVPEVRGRHVRFGLRAG